MKSLEARLDALEKKVEALKLPEPGLVVFGAAESDDEAKARFELERGYPFPPGGKIIRFEIVDCSIPDSPMEA